MEIIIQADTIESAIYEGLKKINKNRNDVKITILEKGDKDFLGLTGNKNAKIKIEYEDSGNNNQKNHTSSVHHQQAVQQQQTQPSKSQNFKNSDVQNAVKKNQVVITENEVKETENLLNEIFSKMNLSSFELKSNVQDGGIISVEIISPDSSLLIGKHGKTLSSLQLIVNTILNNNRENKISVVLDSENYRHKRVEALEKLAENSIQKLKRFKKDVTLPPMSNTERKIIHNYLSNKSNIKSESIGVEPTRRIKLRFEGR
ncbi:Jag N-terminal domain-containing protein [Candidatus Dependentiae bacterium]|nr:Jag N-terminal domain-containing protein [Candidatus Dependentiae bacterium]